MRYALLAVAFVGCADPAATTRDAAAGDVASAPDVGNAPDVVSAPDVVEADAPRVIAPCDAAVTDGGLVVRGRAYNFGPGGSPTRGSVVRALEHPERCAVVDARSDFALHGFAEGDDVSLTMEHPDFPPIQTGTHRVPAAGITGITFQAPSWGIYRLMATAARVVPMDDRCQIAATVTAVGLSIDSPTPSHGEAGATVTIEPVPADAVGPIYFNYYGPGSILPDRALRETTRDGGVLWLNVPPGDYTLTAHKAGVRFTQARFRCRAGWLVNASPPMGLQALP